LRRDIGETRNTLGPVQSETADGAHCLRAVQQRDAFLCFELQRFDSCAL